MKASDFIAEIYKKFPLLLIGNVLLLIAVSIFGALSLIAIGPLVDFLIDPTLQNVSPLTQKAAGILMWLGLSVTLRSWVVVLIIIVTLVSIFQVMARYSILKTKYAVLRDLMSGTFEDFFNAQWYFFTSGRQGTLLNTFTREIAVIGNAFGAMALFFANILQLFFYLAVPVYFSWQVTLISLGGALIFSVPFFLVGRYNYRLGQSNTATANEMTSIVHENLSLAKLFLGFGNQREGQNRFLKAFDNHCRVSIKSQALDLAIPLLYRPFAVTTVIIALFAAQWFKVPLSGITILLAALLQVAISINNITAQKNALENFFPSYEQIKQLRERARQMRQVSGAKKFTGFEREITLGGVTFFYPRHPPVLDNIHIVIPKGKMIAFVGKSGAGKSTLIDLIMGFHEPSHGSVMLDGVSLREYELNSYRERIGYVPQESSLFNMSIRDNLLWANPHASLEKLENVCQLVYVDEFVGRLTNGYDTLVGDRGVRLSGGQVQRMALARALLRQPELLVLDEATSALDTHSERFIQRAIENVAKKTTVLVVAHRLSTIKQADYIYVLDQGRVIEEGTYKDLLSDGGRFNAMVKLQELNIAS